MKVRCPNCQALVVFDQKKCHVCEIIFDEKEIKTLQLENDKLKVKKTLKELLKDE